MKDFKSEFLFTLKKPIKCQYKKQDGGFDIKETKEILLKAPSKKNQHIIGDRLQGMFSSAMFRMTSQLSTIKSDTAKRNKRDDKVEIGKKETRLILITGLGEDLDRFYNDFESLLLKEGICYINDMPLTEVELTDLDHNDFKEIMVEYLSNFFIACWTRELDLS